MDITHRVLKALRTPDYSIEHAQFLQDHVARLRRQLSSPPLQSDNPVCTDISSSVGWLVDGCTICGTRIFASPFGLANDALVPNRVDVYIPDQAEHPFHLRDVLGSHVACVNRDMQLIASLGISKFVGAVLDQCVSTDPDWLKRYLSMPFGSRIIFENISYPDPSKTIVHCVSSWNVERQSLSVQAFRKQLSTQIGEDRWPPILDLSNLRLLKQLHDSISLVTVVAAHDAIHCGKRYIFKSTTEDFSFLYHELRFLMSVPRSGYIMPPPIAIVTKRASFGAKEGIVGFLLEYFPNGSIRDKVPVMTRTRSLTPATQIHWCQQVLRALVHILGKCNTFYSDLRLDNVLFRSSNEDAVIDGSNDKLQDLILCDFEQRGNWHEWASPEILFAQYAQNLRNHPSTREQSNEYHDLITAYYSKLPNNGTRSAFQQMEDKVRSKNYPWHRLSLRSAEKAMTYQFGLFMYCIFEGVSNPKRNISNAFPSEFDYMSRHGQAQEPEFPEFRLTPDSVQELIKACTIDAPGWEQSGADGKSDTLNAVLEVRRAPRFFRKGYKLYARYLDIQKDDSEIVKATQSEIDTGVLNSAHEHWRAELQRAGAFLKTQEWASQDFGTRRPTLAEVAGRLESLANGLRTDA